MLKVIYGQNSHFCKSGKFYIFYDFLGHINYIQKKILQVVTNTTNKKKIIFVTSTELPICLPFSLENSAFIPKSLTEEIFLL